MRKYVLYNFKSMLMTLLIVSVICAIPYAAVLTMMNLQVGGTAKASNPNINIVFAQLAILAYVAPMLTLSFRMDKRAADCYYALPFKRKKLYAVATGTGLALVLVPFTLAYWMGYAVLSLRTGNVFDMSVYVYGYFGGLFFGACMFGWNAFAYTRANKVIDGLVLMLAYSFVFRLILWYLQVSPFGKWVPNVLMKNSVLLGATFAFSEGISNLIRGMAHTFSAWTFLVPVCFGTLGYVLFFALLKYDKEEHAEGMTRSFFGFKTLIPLIGILMLGIVRLTVMNVYLVALGVFTGTLFYTKKLRMNWRYWLMMALTIVVGVSLKWLMGFVDVPIVNPPTQLALPLLGL